MLKCARCNKRKFDGARWNSQTISHEFDGKYLCRACQIEIFSNANPLERNSCCQKSNKIF